MVKAPENAACVKESQGEDTPLLCLVTGVKPDGFYC